MAFFVPCGDMPLPEHAQDDVTVSVSEDPSVFFTSTSVADLSVASPSNSAQPNKRGTSRMFEPSGNMKTWVWKDFSTAGCPLSSQVFAKRVCVCASCIPVFFLWLTAIA